MQKKIAIVTSGHPPFDERIFYKFARTFSKNNYQTIIISSTEDIRKVKDNIEIYGFYGDNLTKREKIYKFVQILGNSSPDFIICCEPLSVLAAHRYRKSLSKRPIIFSDITEWYPENVAFKKYGVKKLIYYFALYLFNIYAANLADRLIIGESSKMKRYNLITPTKPKIIIGYYPPKEFFQYSKPNQTLDRFTVCFSGIISKGRGINNVLSAIEMLSVRNPKVKIKLKIIGKFTSDIEKEKFEERMKTNLNYKLEMLGWSDYTEFSNLLEDVDVCLDLREKNFIYNNSLPIKIFDYLACGKPIIYSNIKSLQNETFVESTGYLVDPANTNEVVEKLEIYLKDNDLLSKHSKTARKLFEERFNWENIEKTLVDFIKQA